MLIQIKCHNIKSSLTKSSALISQWIIHWGSDDENPPLDGWHYNIGQATHTKQRKKRTRNLVSFLRILIDFDRDGGEFKWGKFPHLELELDVVHIFTHSLTHYVCHEL